jgi:hypothetical protein
MILQPTSAVGKGATHWKCKAVPDRVCVACVVQAPPRLMPDVWLQLQQDLRNRQLHLESRRKVWALGPSSCVRPVKPAAIY